MAQHVSVVTPERFASGLGYREFLAQAKVNQDRFQENYDGTEITADDVRRMKDLMSRPNGPARVLALGEDWCPDVYRGLPVIAKLCEATGVELRVFPRDQNLDIMNEFLKDGQFQSIPTLVFYTRGHGYICHWIERAKKANEEMPLLREVYAGRTREEAADDIRAFQRGPIWAGWRRAQIEEVLEQLDHAAR